MIPVEIMNMIGEATSGHNDGWTMKYYKDKLLEIYNHIGKVFDLPHDIWFCETCSKPMVVAQHLDHVDNKRIQCSQKQGTKGGDAKNKIVA